MFALTRFEFKKMFSHKRAYLGLLVIFVINVLFSIAFYIRSKKSSGIRISELPGQHLMSEFMNASVYTQSILGPCVYMLFPMIISIMGAHMFAGELEVGSLRMILTRPVSRWQIIISKFICLTFYSSLMLLLLFIVSYTVGSIILKPGGDAIIFGPIFLLKHKINVIPYPETFTRMFYSYTFALPMLAAVSALTLMFAIITRHIASSAIMTNTVYFCSYLASGIPLLSAIHPYLPTRYFSFWKYALMTPVLWAKMGIYALWTFSFITVFLIVGIAVFNLQDT